MPNSPQFMTQILKSPQQLIPNSPYLMMQNHTSPQYINNQYLNSQGSNPVCSNQQVMSQVHTPVNGMNPVMINSPQVSNLQVNACVADLMTVEQTAAWVRTLGYFNRWEEAQEYEAIFRNNGIKGYLLQNLTLESLKSELGISKFGHRMEFMMAIESLFPNKTKITVRNGPVSSPAIRTLVGYENDSSAVRTICSPIGDKKKIKRASPSNPVKYMAVRATNIRAGKLANSNVIGELEGGKIVVVNQIKGRSGRIIEKKKNGLYNVVGWASLHTANGQPCLVRFQANRDE